MPVQTNARLVAVYSAPTPSSTGGAPIGWDYGDQGAGADPAPGSAPGPATGELRATPNAAAYYREANDRAPTPTGMEVSQRRTLIVDTAVALAHSIATDDVLEVLTDAGATIHATASSIARASLPAVPGLALAGVETTRIELASS